MAKSIFFRSIGLFLNIIDLLHLDQEEAKNFGWYYICVGCYTRIIEYCPNCTKRKICSGIVDSWSFEFEFKNKLLHYYEDQYRQVDKQLALSARL